MCDFKVIVLSNLFSLVNSQHRFYKVLSEKQTTRMLPVLQGSVNPHTVEEKLLISITTSFGFMKAAEFQINTGSNLHGTGLKCVSEVTFFISATDTLSKS